jgi:hypothetical protein
MLSHRTPTSVAPLVAHLVAYWSLDETSSTRFISVGADFDASPSGDVTYDTGLVGNAISGSGSSGLLVSGYPTCLVGTNAWTMNAWFKTAAVTGNMGVVSAGNYGGHSLEGAELLVNDNGTVWFHFLGNQILTEFTPDSQWHMLTGTYDGAVAKFYMDGVLQGVVAITLNLGAHSPAMAIGRRSPPIDSAGQFSGLVDEVGVWGTALSAEDITWLYNTGTGRNAVDTIAYFNVSPFLKSYWPLTEASGTRHDVIGHKDLTDLNNDFGSTSGAGYDPTPIHGALSAIDSGGGSGIAAAFGELTQDVPDSTPTVLALSTVMLCVYCWRRENIIKQGRLS